VNYAVRADGRLRQLDFAWPEYKVFRASGRPRGRGGACAAKPSHSRPRRPFEDDRPRQNALVDKEWAPDRVTKRALERDSAAALAPVVRALRRRSTPNASAVNAPSRNARSDDRMTLDLDCGAVPRHIEHCHPEGGDAPREQHDGCRVVYDPMRRR
jgi:hypothetical protein